MKQVAAFTSIFRTSEKQLAQLYTQMGVAIFARRKARHHNEQQRQHMVSAVLECQGQRFLRHNTYLELEFWSF